MTTTDATSGNDRTTTPVTRAFRPNVSHSFGSHCRSSSTVDLVVPEGSNQATTPRPRCACSCAVHISDSVVFSESLRFLETPMPRKGHEAGNNIVLNWALPMTMLPLIDARPVPWSINDPTPGGGIRTGFGGLTRLDLMQVQKCFVNAHILGLNCFCCGTVFRCQGLADEVTSPSAVWSD